MTTPGKHFYVVEFLPAGEGWWFYVEATKREALKRGKELEQNEYEQYKRIADNTIPQKREYSINRVTSWYHGA